MTKTIDEGRAALIERAAQVLNARRLRAHEWPTMQEFAKALADAGLLSDREEIRKVLEEASNPDELPQDAVDWAMKQVSHWGVSDNDLRFAIAAYITYRAAALSSPSVSSEKTPVEFPMTDPRNQDYD